MQIAENVEQVRSWAVQFLSIDAAQAFYKKVKDDVRLFGVSVQQSDVRFHTYEQELGRDLATEFEAEWTKLESEKNPSPEKVMENQSFVEQEPSEESNSNAV